MRSDFSLNMDVQIGLDAFIFSLKTNIKDTISLDYSSVCNNSSGSRIGWVSMKETS